MRMNRSEIIFLSSGRRIKATNGQTLFQALARAGIQLRSECGGKGDCAKCLVRIRKEPDTQQHRPAVKDPGRQPSPLVEHLACQTEIQGNLTIDIPYTSLAPAEVIAKPTLIRRFGPTGTAPNPAITRSGYGLAVDLGTTTIAQFLCDVDQGEVLTSGSVRNPQLIFGDDVVSRISSVASDHANLARMQKLVVAAIQECTESLAQQCGIDTHDIGKVVVVGNSCMIHLFLGMDPSSMGSYPYQPAFTVARKVAATDLGLTKLHPEAPVHTLPLIAGFLGCDVVAAAMAIDLDLRDDKVLMLDVGANGEIMLNAGGDLSAVSCATGPALEGAAITHGMHAVSGAVDAVCIDPVDGSVGYSLIQREPEKPRKAAGICGSGIVSAMAALLRAGVILRSGRFSPESNHPNLRRNGDGTEEFVLVSAGDTQGGMDITLTQQDIRAVQFAKAALFAGITLLCREARIELPQYLLLAGAFGTFLNKKDTITIGMLPRLAENAVETIGNAAGEGAILALLHSESAERAEEIARRTRVVDVASHPDFQKVFVNALAFPDPKQ
jgi:uncharacterized 2Fe-2S/4Fe-4S cluster protein (DUF4445 family)